MIAYAVLGMIAVVVMVWATRQCDKMDLSFLAPFAMTFSMLAVLGAAAYLYEFPEIDLNPAKGRVVVFEGDQMVEKAWGMWTLPGVRREATRVEPCRRLGFVGQTRFGLDQFSPISFQERQIFLRAPGEWHESTRSWDLCLFNPGAFFVDHKRRRFGSQEAIQAWVEADQIAAATLFARDIKDYRLNYTPDSKRMYEFSMKALNDFLWNQGFILVERSNGLSE